jgi:hypothetical protein
MKIDLPSTQYLNIKFNKISYKRWNCNIKKKQDKQKG